MTDTRPFDPALFRDAAIHPETASLNAQIIELFSALPEWWVRTPARVGGFHRGSPHCHTSCHER